MPNPEIFLPKSFSLPRTSVVSPPHPTQLLNVQDLERYRIAAHIIANENDPDVIFRRKTDTEYEGLLKQAEVHALVSLVINLPGQRSPVSIMRWEKNIRTIKERSLLQKGVSRSMVCPSMDELDRIFKVRREGSETTLTSGSLEGFSGLSVLQINTRFRKPAEDLSIQYTYTHRLGPWVGCAAINVPFFVEGPYKAIFDDSDNSHIVLATGSLEKINYHQAVELMLSSANSTFSEFESTIAKIDPIFEEAESGLRD